MYELFDPDIQLINPKPVAERCNFDSLAVIINTNNTIAEYKVHVRPGMNTE